jgi:membrane fusion protein (multidrug efflux system)
VILIPQRAVQQLQSTQTVFTVGAGEKVDVRAIVASERSGDFFVVDQGLKQGDRVIVEGQLKVRPGMVVRTAPYTAPGK